MDICGFLTVYLMLMQTPKYYVDLNFKVRELDTRVVPQLWRMLLIQTWTERLHVDVTVCVPAAISLSSSVQRWTSSANMLRPRAVLCSCKTDLTSPSSPEKDRQEFEFLCERYKMSQWSKSNMSKSYNRVTIYTTNEIHIHHLHKKISLADNVLSLDTIFVFWWMMVRVCRITSAVGIVYGEHVDGDDLQHVRASQ